MRAGAGFTARIITGDGDIAEDQVVSSTGSYSATGRTSSAPWVMQMATFRAAGQGGGQSGADGECDHADIGNGERRDGGDHHGHRLPGGGHGQAGRNIRDRRDRGEQHVDHGDHPGARGGCGQRGGDQHRCPERHADQRLHLHGD